MNKSWKFINKYLVYFIPLVIIFFGVKNFVRETRSDSLGREIVGSDQRLLIYVPISIVLGYILYFAMHKFMWWRWERAKKKLLQEGRVTVAQTKKYDTWFRWGLSVVWGGLLYTLFSLLYHLMLMYESFQWLQQF